jgi:hypothetical protein
MNDRLVANMFRFAVLALLGVIAVLQWQQKEELNRLRYSQPDMPRVLNVKVVNSEKEPVPVGGSVKLDNTSFVGNRIVEHSIPVRVTNSGGITDSIPVRIDRP